MNALQATRALTSILRSLATVAPPGFDSESKHPLDHTLLGDVLAHMRDHPANSLQAVRGELVAYVETLAEVEPDSLTRSESLAYWLNLYNAGALRLAATAEDQGVDTVLRVPGGFSRPIVSVSGESLSLDAIEHAKIRRYRDPRIHGALVCGSVSCPTLRSTPFTGADLDRELSEQMQGFLAGGGLRIDVERERVDLSRVFQWFGADFVRPHRMPTFLPVSGHATLTALASWLDPHEVAWIEARRPSVEFDSYDWSLRCTL